MRLKRVRTSLKKKYIYIFWINGHHTLFLFLIYLLYLFLSVLDYCNLVNSHLKSSHWPDALKSMIFIFTITIIGPIKTGKTQSKKKTNICMFSALYFVWCLFFYSNYKKREKYIAIIIKRRLGGVTQEYYDWQTNNHNTAQVPTYGEKWKVQKIKTKEKNNRIRQKQNQRNWHLWSLIQLATEGTRKIKNFPTVY